jgi:hypothetical protein
MRKRFEWLRAAVALLLVSAGCAAPLHGQNIDGTWTLIEIDARPVSATAAQRVPSFTVKGQDISGFDGCNMFQGRLDKPGSITSTRRGCPDGTVRLPLDLGDPMAHLAAAQMDGKRLRLPARNSLPASVLMRVE